MAKKQENEVQTVEPAPETEQPTNDRPTPAREEKKLDKTIPGGRYIVNGQTVNCNGEPIEE